VIVGAVVQARMGSTRLPGKVLADLAGEPVLARIVQRLRAATTLDTVVVATSTAPGDDAVEQLAAALEVPCVRGSEDDVLGRYVAASQAHNLDATVRITADCPLLDPALVDEVVDRWRREPQHYDFVANTLVRRYPRGLDVALVTAAALVRASAHASGTERVHVTPYIRDDRNGFRLCSVEGPEDLGDLRWTLDEPADLTFLQAVYRELTPFPDYSWRRVLALLRQRPDLSAINEAVRQKVTHEG
jgi:spore coat polysaccharide biosynthesis protein SpsF